MERITTIPAVREAVGTARAAGDRIGLVPTMGALHEGHLSLVRRAAEMTDFTVVSIFVNPIQFGPDEDLEDYPRELEGDEAKLRALGKAAPQVVFAPATDHMYPDEPLTTVHVDRLSATLCGATRPEHFDGVATVVTKLLNIVTPDVAVFGRKDYQQLVILRRLAADLNLPVGIVGGPLVREPDGVAMSSRNHYLDRDERKAARSLSRGLADAVREARRARQDERRPDPDVLRETVRATLAAESDVDIDYVAVVDPDTLEPREPAGTPPGAADSGPGGDRPTADAGQEVEQNGGRPVGERMLVAVAAHVGPARLIDNVLVGDTDDEQRLLEATG